MFYHFQRVITLTCFLLLGSIIAFSQSEKKLKKNLTVLLAAPLDPTAPISFDRKNSNKHGWEYAAGKFEDAFNSSGFKVVPLTASTTGHHYVLIMDYDYGYAIANYKMQYSDLRGQIIDLGNNSQSIGTVIYKGRYENDELSSGIASELLTLIQRQKK